MRLRFLLIFVKHYAPPLAALSLSPEIIPGQSGQTTEGGLADLFAFGRPFIANPDLPYRLRNNLPLTTVSNPATLLAEAAQAIPIIRATKPTRHKVMVKKH